MMDGEPPKKKKRENKPTCRLCKNHNLKILSSGHKEHCPGQHCICEKCHDQKEDREKTANETKKSRAEKQEIERQERIKLNGSELVKFEAEKDIIPFIIPAKYRDRLQNSIDKEVFKYINFKNEILTSFEVQKGKKRKANIKEEESSEKITPLNEDLLQYTLLCLCSCLGYDIRYTTNIFSSTIKKIIAIFCEYPGEDKEKSSDDGKRRISSVCQETVHKLRESHRKCLQNPQYADMYRDQYLFNGIVNQKVDWRLENDRKCLGNVQENSVQYPDIYNSVQCTYMDRVNQEVDLKQYMEQYRKYLQSSVHCTNNICSSGQSTDMYRAHCLLNRETSQNLFWPLLLNYSLLPKPSTEHPSYKPNTDI